MNKNNGLNLQEFDDSLTFNNCLYLLAYKAKRKIFKKGSNDSARMKWSVKGVSDAVGPADNVRNYLERKKIRAILADVSGKYCIESSCDVACGYGRLTMVLEEFSKRVVGFEREPELVEIARQLLPTIEFCQVDSLERISSLGKGVFDFAMIVTVLQHLTDKFCASVIEELKHLAPKGHILVLEKTLPIAITGNTENGDLFISKARSVEEYAKMMEPFKLVSVSNRVLEPGYHNPEPGSCMLFRSPELREANL